VPRTAHVTGLFVGLKGCANGILRGACMLGTHSNLGCRAAVTGFVINAIFNFAVDLSVFIAFHCFQPPFTVIVSLKGENILKKFLKIKGR
jgi:hypothetical protein